MPGAAKVISETQAAQGDESRRKQSIHGKGKKEQTNRCESMDEDMLGGLVGCFRFSARGAAEVQGRACGGGRCVCPSV